jgi:hypothetical protein
MVASPVSTNWSWKPSNTGGRKVVMTMRSWATWLLVGGLAALGTVAIADALRGSSSSTDLSSSGAPVAAATEPASDDLQGLIVVGSSCVSLRVFRLPNLIELEPPRQMDCDGIVWSGDGTLYASCLAGYTNVGTSEGRTGRVPGCSPAWRPDGALSVIRDGDLYITRRHGPPQLVISRDELADTLANALEGGGTYRLVEVAWYGTQAFFGIVAGSQRWQRALIAYAPEGVNEVIPELGHDIADVRVSPTGSFVAFARNQPGREIVVLDGSGRNVPSPPIANARAIAWSPDERWVAVSTRTRTFIARTGTERVVFEVPAGGESLTWLP